MQANILGKGPGFGKLSLRRIKSYIVIEAVFRARQQKRKKGGGATDARNRSYDGLGERGGEDFDELHEVGVGSSYRRNQKPNWRKRESTNRAR